MKSDKIDMNHVKEITNCIAQMCHKKMTDSGFNELKIEYVRWQDNPYFSIVDILRDRMLPLLSIVCIYNTGSEMRIIVYAADLQTTAESKNNDMESKAIEYLVPPSLSHNDKYDVFHQECLTLGMKPIAIFSIIGELLKIESSSEVISCETATGIIISSLNNSLVIQQYLSSKSF